MTTEMTGTGAPLALSLSLYSFNFHGADAIVVQRTDYEKDREKAIFHTITDGARIAEIVAILDKLPRKGTKMAKMAACVVSKVIAYKNNTPFAYVDFYRSALKAENTAFYGSGTTQANILEKQLFASIARQD